MTADPSLRKSFYARDDNKKLGVLRASVVNNLFCLTQNYKVQTTLGV